MTSRVFDLRLSARASGSVGSTSRLASSSRITQTSRCPVPAVAGFGRRQSEGIADAFEARKYAAPLLRCALGDELFERRPGDANVNFRVRLGNPLAKLFGRRAVQKQVGE